MSRQIAVNRGVIVKERDLLETWFAPVLELPQESGGNCRARASFCPSGASRRGEAPSPECINPFPIPGDAARKLLNMHKLY